MSKRYGSVEDRPNCGSGETWADAPEYGVVVFGCDDCDWVDSPDHHGYTP
jgi:hypothetical protein